MKPRHRSSRSTTTAPSPSSRARARARALQARPLEELELVNPHAGGIDVGSKENYVCVPAASVGATESPVRSFGVFNEDMDALVEWLQDCHVTSVAMEATGVYWMALCDKLEAGGIAVVLAVPGRKSDVLDCQWLQTLHRYGLLRGAFRPDAPIRQLRTLTRHRAEWVQRAASHVQLMQKALVQMNLQLPLVVSDIEGATGLRIMEAILKGERDPWKLVELRDPNCKKSTKEQMAAALVGHYTEEHLFTLRQNLAAWKFYQKQITVTDQLIEQRLALIPTAKAVVPTAPPKPVPGTPAAQIQRKRKKGCAVSGNTPRRDFTEALRRICGIDLTEVCGLNLLSVLMLIGEIGTDMSRWRSAKAFCSWLGLCPGTKISGGKVLSRRTRKVVNHAATLLRLAAVVVGRTDSWLGRFYRRKAAHLGKPKAITATARKLACVIYHMLKYHEEYVPVDVEKYEALARLQRLRRLRKEAENFGMQLVELEQAA